LVQLEESVRRRIAEILRQPIEKVADATELIDLVAESFVLVEMAIELQEEFHVRLLQEDLNGVRTVADLTRLVASRALAAG
jgi:acyl carrier protein